MCISFQSDDTATAPDGDTLPQQEPTSFSAMGISEEVCRAIEEMGFERPMPIQEAVIPLLTPTAPQPFTAPAVATAAATAPTAAPTAPTATDIIALAQTGTGKTAAFGLPLLHMIDTKGRNIQAVVLAPTRELCLQITDDLRDFARYMHHMHITAVYGGTSIVDQIKAIQRGVQIIVATPGRLIDLMERGKCDLSQVGHIVLDEADEMLNMGFSESIERIFEALPQHHQTLLFSATMSKEVERVAKKYLSPDYKEVVVGSRNEGAENVNHIYYMVGAKDKYLALKRIVDYYPRIFAIIFCRTKVETQEIADKLIKDGYNAEALHGDLSQQQRDLTMQKFRQHLTQLLVATDVAARGLDVGDLTHVINYAMPDDTESYTHRSGRTGRAGKKGTSIAIINLREKFKIKEVEKTLGKQFVVGKLPTPQEICTKQLYRAIDEIEKTDVDDEQIEPFMADIRRHFEFTDKEEILKKVVAREFGRFLNYYKDAPHIEEPQPSQRKERGAGRAERGAGRTEWGKKQPTGKTQEGYTRLFINLGKNQGFYPGEVMQFINRNTRGHRQEVGHIDLMADFCLIEVPTDDVRRLTKQLNGQFYHNTKVVCRTDNGAQHDVHGAKGRDNGRGHGRKERGNADWNAAMKGSKGDRRGTRGAARGRDNDRQSRAEERMTRAEERKALFAMVKDVEEGSARRWPKKK